MSELEGRHATETRQSNRPRGDRPAEGARPSRNAGRGRGPVFHRGSTSTPPAAAHYHRQDAGNSAPPISTARPWAGFRSILCPIDFSEPSRLALRYAVGVATRNRASLTVANVNDPLLVAAAASALHDR